MADKNEPIKEDLTEETIETPVEETEPVLEVEENDDDPVKSEGSRKKAGKPISTSESKNGALMVIVLLILVGVVGYFFYQFRQSQNNDGGNK